MNEWAIKLWDEGEAGVLGVGFSVLQGRHSEHSFTRVKDLLAFPTNSVLGGRHIYGGRGWQPSPRLKLPSLSTR